MATHTVRVPKKEGLSPHRFDPQELSIKVGDTVEWVNEDKLDHTVTSDDGVTFASNLEPLKPPFTKVFSTAGDFAYHCEIHPVMTGVIKVA